MTEEIEEIDQEVIQLEQRLYVLRDKKQQAIVNLQVNVEQQGKLAAIDEEQAKIKGQLATIKAEQKMLERELWRLEDESKRLVHERCKITCKLKQSIGSSMYCPIHEPSKEPIKMI